MTTVPAPRVADILDWLSVQPEDEADCAGLLAGMPSAAADDVLQTLAQRLGTEAEPPDRRNQDELAWLEAFLRFTPEIIRWHTGHGIPAEVSRATLADFGRNLAINRLVHGRFGMDTWPWLAHHFAGQIYQLGRLQYLIHRTRDAIPGVGHGEWILGVHIPESGPLAPDAVSASLAMARPFFAHTFGRRPVGTATCASWLLDPYMSARLDTASNIARFARLFRPYGHPVDAPSDPVYFTFRTRRMEQLDTLPRETALQRMVLERIDDGGAWQLGFGYLRLP